MTRSIGFENRRLLIVAAACCLPGAALADRLGDFQLSNGALAMFAAALSLPGALVCGLLEWVGGKRRFPLWLGAVAVPALIYSEASSLGHPGYSLTSHGPPGSLVEWMQTHTLFNVYWIAIVGCCFNWFTAPLYGTVAMLGLVPDPRRRWVAVWAVSLASLVLACVVFPSPPVSAGAQPVQELIPLWIGAAVSLGVWTISHAWRQRSLARIRLPGAS